MPKGGIEVAELKLNPKQEKFIDEYMIDFNGSRAAVAAGYSEKTARTIATEYLNKPHIKAEIEKRRAENQKTFTITKELVLDEIKEVALMKGLDLRGSDKMKALELLCKYLGILDAGPLGQTNNLADTIRKAFEKRQAEEDSC